MNHRRDIVRLLNRFQFERFDLFFFSRGGIWFSAGSGHGERRRPASLYLDAVTLVRSDPKLLVALGSGRFGSHREPLLRIVAHDPFERFEVTAF